MAGPTQRIQNAVPRTRQHSLRMVLWIAIAVCGILGFGTSLIANRRVVELSDARAAVRARYTLAIEAHQRRLVGVLDQDRGLHAYLESSEPGVLGAFEQGRHEEIDALHDLDVTIGDRMPAELAAAAAGLDDAIARWRDVDWVTAREQRLATGRASPTTQVAVADALGEIRRAHSVMTKALHREEARVFAGFQAAIATTVMIGTILVLLVGVLAAVMVTWILRRTATPLETLSRLAATGAAFPAPTISNGIREVDALAWALHELDTTVRDREQRLAEAHADAVELGRFGEHVQQVVDETELHEVLASRLATVSGAGAIRTLIRNPLQSRLDVALSTDDLPDRVRLPILSEPMKCRAIRTLKPVGDQGSSATACRCDLAPPGGSYLCEPMLAAGELIGVVNLSSPHPHHFTDAIQGQVHGSLGFGATALASIRLLATTRERALRDHLTGAYNRAFLTEHLNQHLALAGRRGETLAVLAIDLDHFKRLNDTYGHAVGDRALIDAVEAINGQARSSDAVVRHGGEEIVVVLVDTGLEGAMIAAERIRKAIEAISLHTDKGAVTVHASIGVAAYPEHGHDQPSLLAAADRALYQAKAAGRNRVVAAVNPDLKLDLQAELDHPVGRQVEERGRRARVTGQEREQDLPPARHPTLA